MSWNSWPLWSTSHLSKHRVHLKQWTRFSKGSRVPARMFKALFGTRLTELTTNQSSYLMRQSSKTRLPSNENLFRDVCALFTIGNCQSESSRNMRMELTKCLLSAATAISPLSATKFQRLLPTMKSWPSSLIKLELLKNFFSQNIAPVTWALTTKEMQISISISLRLRKVNPCGNWLRLKVGRVYLTTSLCLSIGLKSCCMHLGTSLTGQLLLCKNR